MRIDEALERSSKPDLLFDDAIDALGAASKFTGSEQEYRDHLVDKDSPLGPDAGRDSERIQLIRAKLERLYEARLRSLSK